jgi:hypothetical protein
MPTHEEWLANMGRIYADFTDKHQEALAQGVQLDGAVANLNGAYLVALRPHERVISAIRGLTLALQKKGVVVLDSPAIHTTVMDYGGMANFNPAADPDCNKTLELLEEIVEKVLHDIHTPHRQEMRGCTYDEKAIFNRSSLVCRGYPAGADNDYNFVDLAGAIVYEANARGLNKKMPWGAHITVGRFPSDESAAYASRVNEVVVEHSLNSLGRSKEFLFRSVIVGTIRTSPQGVELNVYREFGL